MGNDFGVSLRLEIRAGRRKFVTQLAKIFDNSIVNDRDPIDHMGMRIDLVWSTVGGPAGVPDPGRAEQRILRQPRFQVAKLALGTTPNQTPVLECGDSC